MSSFIESKIACFKDPNLEYGYRRRALLNEIKTQEGVIGSYADIVNPNLRDQKHAQAYFAALNQVWLELQAEAEKCGLKFSEDEEIYWDTYCSIMEERNGKAQDDVDITSLYLDFRNKYFGDLAPELSEDFIVKFSKLPFDISGISYLAEDAAKVGVKRGIRINEKLREFPAEVKVALLHEMVHAGGVRKHKDEFKRAVIDLFEKGAYVDPLIL
jgi:hypothetical protein